MFKKKAFLISLALLASNFLNQLLGYKYKSKQKS